MGIRVRHVAPLVIIALLAGCSASSAAKSAPGATAASPDQSTRHATPTATPTAAATSPGLLGVLAIPADATPWISNTNALMSRAAFVQVFYTKSAWTSEEGLYLRRGFVSGVIQGWTNADGSEQSITIARFANPVGAKSAFDDLTNSWTETLNGITKLGDPVVGGVGYSNPTLDKLGNAKVEFAAYTGDYMIRLDEYTATNPDPAAAKALLQRQYDVLKSGS